MDGLTKQTILLHSSLCGEQTLLNCIVAESLTDHITQANLSYFLFFKGSSHMPKSHRRNPRACQQLSLTRSRPPHELRIQSTSEQIVHFCPANTEAY